MIMQENNINIGDVIRDVEDGDCYYQGVVVSLNPIQYKITNVVWNGENDNYINGDVYELKWWKLQKLNNNKWEEIKAKV